MFIGTVLPAHHHNDSTRSHFTATVSVVATLTALVLGLAISNANTTRVAMIQDLSLLSSNIVQAHGLLRQFGPEADAADATLAQYAAHKLADLFPTMPGAHVNLMNPATSALFDQMQEQLLELKPHNDAQHWRQSQALQLSSQIATARWAIAEQGHVGVPQAVVVVVTFWLAILFGTYGLFTPRHATAIAALILCACAVAAAILMILEARTTFTGLIRIPSGSLVEAVEMVRR
jgi:hypothetical protein